MIDLDEVVTCLPVFQQVLQGFDDRTVFRIAREGMLAFPIVESTMRDALARVLPLNARRI